MPDIKGIFHVHSDYSYDGRHSLNEIAEYARRRGYAFVVMTEHSDTFDDNKMTEYINECRSRSTSDLILIPGIEFSCEGGFHIIGLGISGFISSSDPVGVVEAIHSQNGIAILAHPSRYAYKIAENLLNAMDGIEVWNAVYDGRYVPGHRSLSFLNNVNKTGYSLLAFGGLDLHKLSELPNIYLTLSDCDLDENAIMHHLRNGHFTIHNFLFNLKSNRRLSKATLMFICFTHMTYKLLKYFRNRLIPA